MKGFTLIELLVVVMIVGILSVAALPQYTRAIEKSRATEAMVTAKAIMDAIQRHLQEFPGDDVTQRAQIADVTIQSPVSGVINVYRTPHFRYILDNNSVRVERIDKDADSLNSPPLYVINYVYNSITGKISVTAGTGCDTSKYQAVCDSFTSLYNF